MDAIVTSGLTKKYQDVTAVDGLNLSVGEGGIFSLLGINGAGKTTAIKMLSCVTRPTGGDALIHGKSVLTETRAVKALIAVSPQETAVAPNLSVKENLCLMAGAHGFSREKTASKSSELIERFGLQDIVNKQAKKLSGGWQRRLSIAMALISEPKVLFLDEPTLGLDVFARNDLWDVIRSLKETVTVILTTHYMEEAEMLSDRLAIMKNGLLLTTGSVADIKNEAGCERFEDAFIKLVREGAR